MASTNSPAEQAKVAAQSDSVAGERRAAAREPVSQRQGSLGASPAYPARVQAGWETVQPFGGPPGQQPVSPAFIQSAQPVWPHGAMPYMQPQLYMYSGLHGQPPSYFPAGSLHPAQRPVPQMLSPLGMMVAGQQYPMNPMLPFNMAPAPTQESWLQARQMRPQPGGMPGVRSTGWGGMPFQSPQHPQPQQIQRWQQPQRQEVPSAPSRRPDRMQAQPPPPPPRAGSMPPTAQAQKELAPAGPLPSPTAASASSRSTSLPNLEQQQPQTPRQPEQTGSLGAAPGPSGKVPCAFFLKTGTCAYGDKCKFEHPWDKLPVVRFNSMGLPLRQGQPECAYYMRHARCGFGPSCKFHHPELGTSGVPDTSGLAPQSSPDGLVPPQSVPSPPEIATGSPAPVALGTPASLATGTPVAAEPQASASPSENVAPTSSSSSRPEQAGTEGVPSPSQQAQQTQQPPAGIRPSMQFASIPGSVHQLASPIAAPIHAAAFGMPTSVPAQALNGVQQQQALVQPQALPVASVPLQQVPGALPPMPPVQSASQYAQLPQQQAAQSPGTQPQALTQPQPVSSVPVASLPQQTSPHSATIANDIAVGGAAPSGALPSQAAPVAGQPLVPVDGLLSAAAAPQLPVQQVALPAQPTVPIQASLPIPALMPLASQPARGMQYPQRELSAPLPQNCLGAPQHSPGAPLQPLQQTPLQPSTLQLPQQVPLQQVPVPQVPVQQVPLQVGQAVLPGQQLVAPQAGLPAQTTLLAHPPSLATAHPPIPQQAPVAALPQQPLVAATPPSPVIAGMPHQPVLASTQAQALLPQQAGYAAGQPLVTAQAALGSLQPVPLVVSPAYQALVTQGAAAAPTTGVLMQAHTVPTMQMLSPAASKDIGQPNLEELTAGLPDLHLNAAKSTLDSGMSVKTPLPSEASLATVSTTSSVGSGKLSHDAARAIETVRHAMEGRGSFREEDEEEQNQEETDSGGVKS